MPENIIATDLKQGSRISAGEYNTRGKVLQGIRRSNIPNTLIDSAGIQQRPNIRAGTSGTEHKIFEVQSVATGDGVYNCFEQKLASSLWDDVAGANRFSDINTVNVAVLNLHEANVIASYERALALYDTLDCWKWKDDTNTVRWVGTPLSNRVRLARLDGSPGAGLTINCNLFDAENAEITSGLGSGITVNFKISRGSAMNAAFPRLVDNEDIFVENIHGKWWCTQTYGTTEDCVCS